MKALFSVFVIFLAMGVVILISDAQTNPTVQYPDIDSLQIRPDLPDPFTMLDGSPVLKRGQWFKNRRPELKKLFQYYMYGFMPEPPKIQSVVSKTDEGVFGGKARLKEVELSFPELPPNAPRIHLAVFIPKNATGPFPVFLGVNSHGNQTVVDYPGVTFNENVFLRDGDKEKGANERGALKDFWCVENTINRGYAFAVYYQGDVDPDKDDFSDGVHPFYANLPVPKEAQWGTISAWAWGLHRCIDYLVQDNDIDKSRISLIGHSRRGKTVLLAAALDERVALVVPHQSGTGGCALSRNNNQETVERINTVFPHWFDGNFKKFNQAVDKLPFDQHLLVALVAPRALLETAGLQDAWANYESALLGLKAADNVYKFLGVDGMVDDGVINGDEPITADTVGSLLQYRKDIKHTLEIGYWNRILDFADVYFAKRSKQIPLRVSEVYPTTGSVERLDPALDALVPPGAQLEVIARGFNWSEGPVWIKDGGYLLFSDIPTNTLYKWQETDGLSVYLTPAGYTGETPCGSETGPNGLLLNLQNQLVICQHGDRRVARMDAPLNAPKPAFVALAEKFEEKRFNSPNDAVFHKNGDLFFTDPPYGLAKGVEDPSKEIPFQGVFRMTPDGKVTLVSNQLSSPNGITFSPDYKTLYVANSDAKNPIWMAFSVLDDGGVGEGRIFFEGKNLPGGRNGGGDGLKTDGQGNLFATGPGGVLVIDPQGKLLGTILTGQPTANCAFGDDGKTLYITTANYLMRIRLNVKGMGFE